MSPMRIVGLVMLLILLAEYWLWPRYLARMQLSDDKKAAMSRLLYWSLVLPAIIGLYLVVRG
ncbi:MAG: hypothetical protein M1369_01975 [Deinococcus sp.]|nr:hypothetical protein [Deinococcus sp.]MCL5964540.1 hypothetical protein [Deinococcus sp.]